MEVKKGYIYFIDNSFFELPFIQSEIKGSRMLGNKGEFNRPFYCCDVDDKGLIWLVPLSTQINKYKKVNKVKIEKYGLKNQEDIFFGKVGVKLNAFLLQNMFPIESKYIKSIYNYKGNPLSIHTNLKGIIEKKFKVKQEKIKRGIKCVFPSVNKMVELILKKDNITSEEHQEEIKSLVTRVPEGYKIFIDLDTDLQDKILKKWHKERVVAQGRTTPTIETCRKNFAERKDFVFNENLDVKRIVNYIIIGNIEYNKLKENGEVCYEKYSVDEGNRLIKALKDTDIKYSGVIRQKNIQLSFNIKDKDKIQRLNNDLKQKTVNNNLTN